MAQTGYTPISLFYSSTASNAPSAGSLVAGELAINTADGKLFYKDSSNAVQVLATKSTGSIGGSNTQVQFNNSGSLGGSSGLTWDGSFLTTSSIKNSALTSGRVTYAGASGLLKDSANMTFDDTSLTLGGQILLSNNNYIGFKNTSASVSASIFNDTSNFLNLYNSSNTGTIFYVNAGERLRLTNTTLYTASGVNVGIGTSNPNLPLDIYRSTFTSSTPFANQLSRVSSLGSGADASIVFSDSVANNGYIGIQGGYLNFASNTTTPQLKLDTSGNLGLGVTPSAADNTLKYVTVGNVGNSFAGFNGNLSTYVLAGTYYNGGWKYAVSSSAVSRYDIGAGSHAWLTAPSGTAGNAVTFTQAMTLDASGNLLLGTTTSPSGSGNLAVGQGAWNANTGYFQLVPKFTSGTGAYYFYDNSTGFFPLPDNTQALGNPSYRWTTVYATTALINTSDVNTKQQIRDLSTAEKAVAQSIKGLIKAYKFNDSVAEKGDGARIHIGVIAQDVQSAFIAQGLDSSKYAMFCSNTWYEVNGKAHSEKDGFYTKDSPNAVEVTRLGIRYDELLAFVISTL